MEYRIIDKGTGKWLLQQRDKYEKNWRFIADDDTALGCFKKILHNYKLFKSIEDFRLTIFRIKIEKQKA